MGKHRLTLDQNLLGLKKHIKNALELLRPHKCPNFKMISKPEVSPLTKQLVFVCCLNVRSNLARQYRTKAEALQLKKVEVERLNQEFESKLRRKEVELLFSEQQIFHASWIILAFTLPLGSLTLIIMYLTLITPRSSHFCSKS